MRVLVIAALAVAFLAAPAAAGSKWQPISISDARTAARMTALDIALPFGEHAPKIKIRCHRVTRSRVTCQVHFRVDRLQASFDTTVKTDRTRFAVYARNLTVMRG